MVADTVKPPPAVPCVVTAAIAELGVTEENDNAGPRVERYLGSVGLGPHYPWCAAYVHFCFRGCGEILEPHRDFAAAAQFASAHQTYRKGQELSWTSGVGEKPHRLSQDGETFELFYQSLNRIGHVGLIIGEEEDYLIDVEGNSNTNGSREGTTVVKRKRLKSTIYSLNNWLP